MKPVSRKMLASMITALFVISIVSISQPYQASGDGVLNTFFTWEGYGGYVACGVGTWGSNSGTINLQGIPSGAAIVNAFVYWACPSTYGLDTFIYLDGNGVMGNEIGHDGIMYGYRGNVTNLVSGNGVYEITDISNAYGVSIVAIYSESSMDYVMVIINDGMDTNYGQVLPHWLTPTTFSGFEAFANPQAKTTYIMGDGQTYHAGVYAHDKYSFNGNVIAIDEADGSDGNPTTHGWDTDTYDVSAFVSAGDTSATANMYEENDELGWVAQIFSITVVPPTQNPPVANAGADQIIYEGDDVLLDGSASFDPDGLINKYEWDFDARDGLWWDTAAPPDATGAQATHVYGDNGIFTVTLRVTDELNLSATDACNITVLNVDPNATIESAVMDVEIGLRVAGRKYNDVGMTLFEGGNPITYLSIERMAGSPDDQMAWVPVILDMTKIYSASVTFTPEDPPNVGANPVWIYLKFENGSVEELHHTFNVQQSKVRNSNHWNHVEPWEVDLNVHLVGHAFKITTHVKDPGSDDEFLTQTYCSQIINVAHLNNPPNPDPYPSPDVNPRDITDISDINYEGTGILDLTIADDDGGTSTISVLLK